MGFAWQQVVCSCALPALIGRYESLKAEEAVEMQTALEAKFGVVQRKRVPLLVNDTVVLYFKVSSSAADRRSLLLQGAFGLRDALKRMNVRCGNLGICKVSFASSLGRPC